MSAATTASRRSPVRSISSNRAAFRTEAPDAVPHHDIALVHAGAGDSDTAVGRQPVRPAGELDGKGGAAVAVEAIEVAATPSRKAAHPVTAPLRRRTPCSTIRCSTHDLTVAGTYLPVEVRRQSLPCAWPRVGPLSPVGSIGTG